MSFTEQQLSEGIRTSHEFSNSKRRLKRNRDERDSSRQSGAKNLVPNRKGLLSVSDIAFKETG